MAAEPQSNLPEGVNNEATGLSIREQETGLTLRRLEVWIDEWRLRMRMMSVCVEGAKGIFSFHSLGHLQWIDSINLRCAWRRLGKLDTRLYRQR